MVTMPKTFSSEKHVKQGVKYLLNKYDWFWWMPAANGFGRSGVPDFNALKNGVFMAIETKFGDNKATPLQKGFIESVCSQQGQGFVVTEKNLTYLEQWLSAFDANVEAVRAGKPGQDPRQLVDPDQGSRMINATLVLMDGLK